jgi:hypothetical protein
MGRGAHGAIVQARVLLERLLESQLLNKDYRHRSVLWDVDNARFAHISTAATPRGSGVGAQGAGCCAVGPWVLRRRYPKSTLAETSFTWPGHQMAERFKPFFAPSSELGLIAQNPA